MEEIANNSEGYIIIAGILTGINTDTYSNGQMQMFLSGLQVWKIAHWVQSGLENRANLDGLIVRFNYPPPQYIKR